MTPEQVIRRARSLDFSFTEERHPPTVAFEFFGRALRSLMSLVGREHPEVVTQMAAFDLPEPGGWDAGIELSAPPASGSDPVPINYSQIHAYSVHRDDHQGGVFPGEELLVVPFRQRYSAPFRMAATVAGNRLFFIGSPEAWSGYREVRVFYTPAFSEPDWAGRNAAVDLPLPPVAFDVLIDHVALLMARRNPAEAQVVDWAGALQETRQTLLEELSRRQGGETWHVSVY